MWVDDKLVDDGYWSMYMMLIRIHESRVFELRIETKFEVCDPRSERQQTKKLRGPRPLNAWLECMNINEDYAQLPKGYYHIATISLTRSAIVTSVTSRANHLLCHKVPLSFCLRCFAAWLRDFDFVRVMATIKLHWNQTRGTGVEKGRSHGF